MRQIESLIQRLDQLEDLEANRQAIFDLIRDKLCEKADTLDDWEKFHFKNAIAALALNVNSFRQPSLSWLRLCVADFRLALMPLEKRSATSFFDPVHGLGELPDFVQLMSALDEIAIRIGIGAQQAD